MTGVVSLMRFMKRNVRQTFQNIARPSTLTISYINQIELICKNEFLEHKIRIYVAFSESKKLKGSTASRSGSFLARK